MLRVAAIGYGDIAQRRHIPQILTLGDRAELVAIGGRDAGSLAACAGHFGIARWHTDIDAILSDGAIDAVLILTPPDSHCDLALRAIDAGKHVLVEKPLVGTAAQAAALLQAVRARQAVRPLTCFPLPHVATAEHGMVRQLVAAGAVGDVTSVECHRGHRGPTHADWFYRRDRAGGGVLIDLGIYQLTTVAALFGPAARMTASLARRFDEREMDDGRVVRPDVEDSAAVLLTLVDGTAVTVNVSWNGCQSHHETRMRTVVIGRRGILHFGVADGGIYVFRPDGDYAALHDAAPAEFDGHACRRLAPPVPATPPSIVGAFLDRIAAGDSGLRELAIQTHVLEIIEAAYDGARDHAARPIASRF